MSDDFLKEMGYISLATRLKRLSDKLIHSGRELYKSLEVDIEPNWYMLFKLLQRYERLTVMEISRRLQLSHPSVISIIEKMTAKGFLQADRCTEDGRKQLVSLSQKAQDELPQLEAIWEAGIKSISDMLGSSDLLPILDH